LRQFLLQLLQVILIASQFLAQQGQLFFLLGQIQFVRRIAESFLAQPFAALDDGLQARWACDLLVSSTSSFCSPLVVRVRRRCNSSCAWA
jgi:hypothetical protein